MSPCTIAFVAPWECSRPIANIPRTPRLDGVVLFLKSVAKGAALPWHRQKLVLVLSAMHHFAESLIQAGYRVAIRAAPSYADGLVAAASEFSATRIVLTEGREQDMVDEIARAELLLRPVGVPVVRRPDRGDVSGDRLPHGCPRRSIPGARAAHRARVT